MLSRKLKKIWRLLALPEKIFLPFLKNSHIPRRKIRNGKK